MKNDLGEIIYVGKAKILKNRVRQYFQNSKNHSDKVRSMVKRISEFEYIVTDSEMEALILECNLIKKYSPKYNIALKDDKIYPFIKITIKEDFPKVYVTRNFIKDGSKYFGPYTNVSAVHETMNLINKVYQLRTCKRRIEEGGVLTRPCLNYHINKCNAPCGGLISREDYGKIINEIIEILNGTDKSILAKLKYEMETEAKNLNFEKAAGLRDKILAIQSLTEKQKIFKVVDTEEDYIDLYVDDKDACVQIFFMRNGKISGREHFIIENAINEKEEVVLAQFIINFYSGTAKVPKIIYAPHVMDTEILEEFLTIKRESKVYIKTPVRGEKIRLLEMVKENAKLTLEQFKSKILRDKVENEKALEELREKLDFEERPFRIEAYDISNIQGVDSVGTMIVFEDGKAKNSDYRKFKIKTVKGADDYSSMREILTRRFKRGLEEIKKLQESNLEIGKGKFYVFPDLIMMDGGKGQINIAIEVLRELNINIPVCGLVKDDKHRTRGIIYNNEEILIGRNTRLMMLITRIQDEVHRFAITYHRVLRDKRTLHSVLDDINGIGQKRRMALLSHFGGVERIKGATMQELCEVNGMDKKSAESVFKYFTGNKT